MFLPSNKSQALIQHDSCYYVGDECLDDITEDLVSLTLSDPVSSSFNFDTKNLVFHSSPKTNCDNSHVHTTKDTASDSLIDILNSHSEKNPVFSSTEMLTQDSDVQTSKICDISSQNFMRDSETLNNKNEKVILSSLEHTTSEQNASAHNIHGNAQSHINQDKNTTLAKCKLSLSLHDVSSFTDIPLKCKSRDFSSDTIQSHSGITISSGLKSKDSGLPRSVSCFSLSSGGKSYEHIQSKVKEYIRQIKEADERRKSLKLGDVSSKNTNAEDVNYVSDENNSAASEKTWTALLRGLHNELREKDTVLAELQGNYDRLLIRYAEAENRIDHLRFKAGDSSVKQTSQKEDCHVPGSEKLVLGVTNKFTSPYKRTSDIRTFTKLVPVVKDISNDEIPTYGKVRSSVAQFKVGTRQHLSSNATVKPYCSSLRLDKRMKSLSNNSRAKPVVESFKSESSDVTGLSEGRLSSERTYRSSVTQSSNMCVADNNISSAASSYQKNICQGMENTIAQGEVSCEDVRELDISQFKQCQKVPVVSDVKIPKHTSYYNETLLCKKLLEQSEVNYPCNAFEKVTRWQESLPPFDLIEPKCDGNLYCHSSGSKISSQNYIKKFISSGGRDSGCPCSDLNSFAVCPNSVKLPSSQAPKYKTVLIGAKDMSLRTEPETVAQPVHHKVALQSLACDKTFSGDGRILDNGHEFHMPVSVSYSIKLSECSQNTIIPNRVNIDSCECWNPEVELSGDIKEASGKLEPCDRKPKNAFQDFHVPPLKLGSLLDGDDSSKNVAQSLCSSGVTAISETEAVLKDDLNCSVFEESLSSSHQGTSEDITYPSSTHVTSDSQVYKTHNKLHFGGNKVCPPSSLASDMGNRQCLNYNLLKTCSKEAERSQCNNVQPPKDYAFERMNKNTMQNCSTQTSVTASTSYRSIQPYKPVRQVGLIATQHYARVPTHLAQTSDHGIFNGISVQQEECQSSVHAVGAVKSRMSRRKSLGSALRSCLLEFLNAENCLCSDCICQRSTRKPDAPRNNVHYNSILVDSGGRNISYAGTAVNLTSTVNEKTSATDKVLRSAGVAASQGDLNCKSGRMNDVDSTVIPEEVKCNLMKYLNEMDHCAQQLKARSETILNILALQLKPGL